MHFVIVLAISWLVQYIHVQVYMPAGLEEGEACSLSICDGTAGPWTMSLGRQFNTKQI